jgi:hypothetical protein
MKKTTLLLFPVCIALLLFSCKPSSQQAAEYNDKIIGEVGKVQTADDAFAEAISDTGGAVMEEKLKMLNDQITSSTTAINGLEKFDDKEEFKSAAITFLGHFKKQAETEYKELTALAKKEERSDEDVDRANVIIEGAGSKRKEAEDKLSAAQEAFAKEYNIKLEHK